MTEFRSHRCWDGATVQETIWSDIGAFGLEDDALFLATHVTLPVERLKPSSDTTDENAILRCVNEALERAGRQNLVVAITGPSGSGKSHLVRWVRAHLNDEDPTIEIVYIPRRVTTLREITQLLLHHLGGDIANELQVELDQAIGNTGPKQLGLSLFNRLTEMLSYKPMTQGLAYSETFLPVIESEGDDVLHGGLAYLLGNDKVRDHLLSPGGTIDRLAHSILGTRGDVAEDLIADKPAFTAEELQLHRLTGVKSGLPAHAMTALNMLMKDVGREAAASLLNVHRDAAVQEVLGLRQGRGLHEVFSDARKRLRDRQLVLMFEDLALMDFVEGAVLDEFANHGDAEHAPLRVIFAVTDDKYATLAETIEGRVTDHFAVGEAPLNALDEAGVARRNRFIGLYFNAARVGRTDLVEAYRKGPLPPNRCTACKYRVECHQAFGAADTQIGPVGLYPLNATAIGHGLAHLANDRHQRHRVLTPRVVIDELVKFVLLQAEADLASGQMPSAQLASVVDDGSAMSTPVDLVPEFPEGTIEQDRYFRVRAWWFDCRVEAPEVATAFDLPSIIGGPPPPPPPPTPGPPQEVDTVGALPEVVQGVVQWVQGNDFDARTSEELRRLLHGLTEQRLGLDRFLIHSTSALAKALTKAALGDASFDIEGASGRTPAQQLAFPVKRSNASGRLLVAAWWFRDHQHWDFGDPKRKWNIPFPDPTMLPVELETFLTECATSVEGAVVASLMSSGSDPVRLAVTARRLAERAVASNRRIPRAWEAVHEAAAELLLSEVPDDVVLALAAARQGPTAAPAAIDVLRTTPAGWDELPDANTELARDFDSLTRPWAKLRRAISEAAPSTLTEIRHLVQGIQTLVGEDTFVAVAESVSEAIMLANNEGVLGADIRMLDLNRAVERLAQNTIDPRNPDLLMNTDEAFSEEISRVLELLASAPNLIDAHEDLELIDRALTATRAIVDERIAAVSGSELPQKTREQARNALTTLTEAAKS